MYGTEDAVSAGVGGGGVWVKLMLRVCEEECEDESVCVVDRRGVCDALCVLAAEELGLPDELDVSLPELEEDGVPEEDELGDEVEVKDDEADDDGEAVEDVEGEADDEDDAELDDDADWLPVLELDDVPVRLRVPVGEGVWLPVPVKLCVADREGRGDTETEWVELAVRVELAVPAEDELDDQLGDEVEVQDDEADDEGDGDVVEDAEDDAVPVEDDDGEPVWLELGVPVVDGDEEAEWVAPGPEVDTR